MKKRTRSILEELNILGTARTKELLIENRGLSIIESAINLLTLVKEQYSPEEALELERRFLSAVKASDPKKFKRGLAKIQESRRTEKNNQKPPLN
jgi:hypothetical protein